MLRARLGPQAPQDRAQPRQELTRPEGFGYIVVGAELEADHAVRLVPSRREHDDRDRAAAADAPEHFQAVHPWHHHVEEHHIERARGQRREPTPSIGSVRQREALRLEVTREQLVQSLVVIDEEHASGHGPSLDSLLARRFAVSTTMSTVSTTAFAFVGARSGGGLRRG